MKITVYLDMLIITNLLVNYFLLKITAVIAGIAMERKRAIAASVTGALFSLSIFLPQNIPVSFIIKTASVMCCCLCAFGFVSLALFIRNSACLLAANLLLSGFLMAVFQNSPTVYINNLNYYFNINPVLLAACIFAVYGAITAVEMLHSRADKRLTFPVTITLNGKSVSGTAIYDTGFKVRDILGNRPVVMCEYEFFRVCMEEEQQRRVEDFASGNPHGKIIPIFYSDVSDEGMLAGVKVDELTVCLDENRKKVLQGAILALAQKKILSGAQIIFGKEIYNILGE